ncbi:MAG: hypothetical protein M1834_004694 [Cirrosporium novae-zelandiae]|nr:MAG: hypothetical protein M1834_004694 [Cirrosporium novae-zelandiae]
MHSIKQIAVRQGLWSPSRQNLLYCDYKTLKYQAQKQYFTTKIPTLLSFKPTKTAFSKQTPTAHSRDTSEMLKMNQILSRESRAKSAESKKYSALFVHTTITITVLLGLTAYHFWDRVKELEETEKQFKEFEGLHSTVLQLKSSGMNLPIMASNNSSLAGMLSKAYDDLSEALKKVERLEREAVRSQNITVDNIEEASTNKEKYVDWLERLQEVMDKYDGVCEYEEKVLMEEGAVRLADFKELIEEMKQHSMVFENEGTALETVTQVEQTHIRNNQSLRKCFSDMSIGIGRIRKESENLSAYHAQQVETYREMLEEQKGELSRGMPTIKVEKVNFE